MTDRKKIVVLGAGPIRIGQGVEFDYSTVHAVMTIKNSGYEAIIINNNPETVSTDYTTADKLYFEPLTPEDVMNIIEFEKPEGVIASLGGQTAINLAQPLMDRGVKIIGTDCLAIERAENRDIFEKILSELNIPQPKGRAVTRIEDGIAAAKEIGYPVLVRPSFVLGGRAMQIVANEKQLRHYLKTAVEIDEDKPVLVDKYIQGKEVEVDAICDGVDVFVPGIMELVERTGVHSGDSISVYPTFSISDKVKGVILQYARKLGLGIGIVGLYNIQFIVDKDDNVFIIEVNPRSSRTVPFLSKATGYSLADIATEVILGKTLKEQGIFTIYPDEKKRWYVKVPVFSFNKLRGLDAYLSPEMKSTGEAIGYDDKLNRALFKALQASGMRLQNYGAVFACLSRNAPSRKPAYVLMPAPWTTMPSLSTMLPHRHTTLELPTSSIVAGFMLPPRYTSRDSAHTKQHGIPPLYLYRWDYSTTMPRCATKNKAQIGVLQKNLSWTCEIIATWDPTERTLDPQGRNKKGSRRPGRRAKAVFFKEIIRFLFSFGKNSAILLQL